jgi:hypothetical protein
MQALIMPQIVTEDRSKPAHDGGIPTRDEGDCHHENIGGMAADMRGDERQRCELRVSRRVL